MEKKFSKIPIVKRAIKERGGRMIHSRDGVLGGKITKVKSSKKFFVRDPKGNRWLINCSDNTRFKGVDEIKEGVPVIIIGEVKKKGIFNVWVVRRVRPFSKRKPGKFRSLRDNVPGKSKCFYCKEG